MTQYTISYPAPSFRESFEVDADYVRSHLSNLAWAELKNTGTVYYAHGSVRISELETIDSKN